MKMAESSPFLTVFSKDLNSCTADKQKPGLAWKKVKLRPFCKE